MHSIIANLHFRLPRARAAIPFHSVFRMNDEFPFADPFRVSPGFGGAVRRARTWQRMPPQIIIIHSAP